MNGKRFNGIIVKWRMVLSDDGNMRVTGETLCNPKIHNGAGIVTSPVQHLFMLGEDLVVETMNSVYVLD